MAFATKFARLAENDCAVLLERLIEDEAQMRTLEELREQRFAVFDWLAA
jgi:hypothetical protein